MGKTVGILTFTMISAISLHFSAQSANATTKRILKKTTSSIPREIPTIKCDALDSIAACKSFRQLVEAEDKGVLKAVLGEKPTEGTHIAYVCFAPKADRFTILYYDQPLASSFSKHTKDADVNQEAAYGFYLAGQRKISLGAMNAWYNDYSDDELYALGTVSSVEYRNGVISDFQDEFGYWSKAPDSSDQTSDFEGQYYWLARIGHSFSADDDPKMAHIAVNESMIEMYFDFTNQNNGTTHYRMLVQKSTGRFTQSFSADGIPNQEESGSCSIYKQQN